MTDQKPIGSSMTKSIATLNDPLPWVHQKCTEHCNMQGTRYAFERRIGVRNNVFAPRPGFIQKREDYK